MYSIYSNTHLFVILFIYFSLQTIFKISPRRYHWGTKHKKRERKLERLSAQFTAEMQHDFTRYPSIPSPRGAIWRNYVTHRMRMWQTGINTFATRQYGRLLLDKYIQSNRECDELAVGITQNQPSLIMLGAAELNPSRPIGIKRNKRCPGVRKLVTSIKKLGHSAVIFVDEYFTSQTCANCFSRFDRNTRQHRFKVCKKCKPTNQVLESEWLPMKIVTQLGKRALKAKRQFWRNLYPNHGIQLINQRPAERLVSKVVTYRKNWQPTVLNGELKGKTIVWHRDIVAARCILYKGKINLTYTYTYCNIDLCINYINILIFDFI